MLVEDDNSLSYVDNFIEPPCVPVYPSSLPTCAVSKLPYDRNITDTSEHIRLLDIARPCDKRKSVLGTDDNNLSYMENLTEQPDIPVSPSSLFTDVSKVHYDGDICLYPEATFSPNVVPEIIPALCSNYLWK